MTLKLLKLKASNVWFDSSFSALLELKYGIVKTKWFAHQHLPSKEDHLFVDFGCRKNSFLPEPLDLIPKRTRIKR
jgi:hypothetical protein